MLTFMRVYITDYSIALLNIGREPTEAFFLTSFIT